MTDVIAEFTNFLTSQGVILDRQPAFDGSIERFPTEGRKPGNRDAWFKAFNDDRPFLFGGIHGGQEFKFSQLNGSREYSPEEKRLIDERIAEAKRQRAEEQQRTYEKAAKEAQSEWDAAEPATDNHGYLARKRVKAHGCKISRGRLIIPVQNENGDIRSLQHITAEGEKRFKPGGEIKGNFFTIPGDEARIFIGEGCATMATVHEATGYTCVAAFNAGNLEPVAKKIRQQYPASEILIAADNDQWSDGNPGVTKAMAAAAAINARVVIPQFKDTTTKPTDFNDLCVLEGPEAVIEQLSGAKAEKLSPYKLLTGEDLAAMPDIEWRIHGVFPSRGVGAFFGPSRSGKSFLAFDAGCAIAEGRPWFGYRTTLGAVVMIALEGEYGLKTRASASERHHGRPLPKNFRLVLQPFNLLGDDDVEDLAKAINRELSPGAVVIIDTLNRATPGADENSAKDMGLILQNAKKLQNLIDGLVVFIAHTGKDSAKGIRGHSSLIAALDGSIEVLRDRDQRRFRLDKVKDGMDGAEHPFELEVIELGEDQYGEPRSSCVVAPCTVSINIDEPSKKPLTPAHKMALESFKTAAQTDGLLDADGNFAGLHLEAWRPHFYQSSPAENPAAKQKAFTRARNALVERGELAVLSDIYHPSGDSASVLEAEFAKKLRVKNAEPDTDISRTLAGQCPADTPS